MRCRLQDRGVGKAFLRLPRIRQCADSARSARSQRDGVTRSNHLIRPGVDPHRRWGRRKRPPFRVGRQLSADEATLGSIVQQYVPGASSGPAAMAPLRIHAGLGKHTKVDWLRITWPDAVLQAELELPADRVITVTEFQRKKSSCPYLFAWDGAHFDFVADFGGVGGLGYWIAPGRCAEPDPTEYVRIPQLQPRDGPYVLTCVTALEEVTYLDEAKLIAVDTDGS